MIKKDKIFFLVFHLFVIAFVFFLKTSAVYTNEIVETKFLEYLLMGVYVYTFVTAKIYLDWLNSYMIFLYTSFLFNFTRVFLDVVNYKEFGWATKFANYYFFYEVRQEIIIVFLIVLLCTHLGFFIGILNEDEIELKGGITLASNNLYSNVGLTLFIISLPALAYKM